MGTSWGTALTIEYNEGAEVGYRWFAKTGAKPLYAFGHGLSYTSFAYGDLQVEGGDTITASFTVTNTGDRAGADVPQLYLTEAAGDARMRLLGFERLELEPGESRNVTLTADRRLLARFDADAGQWHVAAGTYKVAGGKASDDLELTGEATLPEARFGS
jgi:beta-glucosidase